MKSEIKDFTKGNITKQLVIFALPLFLSNLLQIVYNMVDMVVVGQVLGKEGISAVSVGGDVTALLTFVAMGFAGAGQVIIARYIGSGKRDNIGKFIGTMCGFLLVVSVIITAGALIFRNGILKLMNTPAEAYDGALAYSTTCMIGLVFISGYNVLAAVLRGMGDGKHPFIFIAVAASINVVLDLVFVIPMQMGTLGAALATVISQAVSFLSCVVFLIIKRRSFGLCISGRDFFVWDKQKLSELVKLGVPMAIKFAAVQVSKLFVNSWINSYGIAVSAFAGIANKIGSVSNLVSSAMNTAGSTVVGQNLAAGKEKRVKRALASLAVITVSIATVLAAVICIAPSIVFGLFTSDSEVLAISTKYLPIAVLLFYGGAGRAIMNALLNGSGNYKINFVTAILDGIVMRIGLALLFGLALGMKHYGFWLGDAIAGFTPFFIGVVYFFTGKWKNALGVDKDEQRDQ